MRPQLCLVIPVGDSWPQQPGHPDHSLPGGGGRPDNSLPALPPVDPSWGVTPPTDPGWGQGHPGGHPGNALPGAPVDPGWGGGWGGGDHPWRPGMAGGGHPSHPIYHPDKPVAMPLPPGNTAPPGTIYPPLPPGAPPKMAVLVWIVGIGYRWAVVSNTPDQSLPGQPARPGQPLPPTAAPKA